MKVQTDYYTIIPYKNLLFIEAFLSWDDRIAKEHIKKVDEIVAKLFQNKPWGLLVDRRNWNLNTPEAEQFFSENSNSNVTKTLTHSAIIVGSSDIKKWQVKKMTKNIKNYETQIFNEFKEAQDWLASFGYYLEN